MQLHSSFFGLKKTREPQLLSPLFKPSLSTGYNSSPFQYQMPPPKNKETVNPVTGRFQRFFEPISQHDMSSSIIDTSPLSDKKLFFAIHDGNLGSIFRNTWPNVLVSSLVDSYNHIMSKTIPSGPCMLLINEPYNSSSNETYDAFIIRKRNDMRVQSNVQFLDDSGIATAKPLPAHRIVSIVRCGYNHYKLVSSHLCGVCSCVNPDHLPLETDIVNGERNHCQTKLKQPLLHPNYVCYHVLKCFVSIHVDIGEDPTPAPIDESHLISLPTLDRLLQTARIVPTEEVVVQKRNTFTTRTHIAEWQLNRIREEAHKERVYKHGDYKRICKALAGELKLTTEQVYARFLNYVKALKKGKASEVKVNE